MEKVGGHLKLDFFFPLVIVKAVKKTMPEKTKTIMRFISGQVIHTVYVVISLTISAK